MTAELPPVNRRQGDRRRGDRRRSEQPQVLEDSWFGALGVGDTHLRDEANAGAESRLPGGWPRSADESA